MFPAFSLNVDLCFFPFVQAMGKNKYELFGRREADDVILLSFDVRVRNFMFPQTDTKCSLCVSKQTIFVPAAV